MSRTTYTSLRQLAQASQPNLRLCTSPSIRLMSTYEPRHLKTRTSSQQQSRNLNTTQSNVRKHRSARPDDDRASMNPERSEYTNSGTDNEVASQRSAYDPKNLDPVRQSQASAEEVREAGDEGNPLDISPANREVSRTLDPMEGGAQRGMDRGPSQRFSPRKGTKVSMGGWTGGGGGSAESKGKIEGPGAHGEGESGSTSGSGEGGGRSV